MELKKYDNQILPSDRMPSEQQLLESKILVIDDEKLITELTQFQLASAGFSNVTALNDSMAALEWVQAEMPDVILTDLKMPDVSGKYLLQFLKKDAGLADIPTIVVSADRVSRETSLALGATFFLAKPVDPNELVECVRACLIRKQFLEELQQNAREERASLRRARMDSCRERESVLRVEVRG